MMKQLVKAITLMLLAILPSFSLYAQDVWDGTTDVEWIGKGTADSPYLIGTAAELAGMAQRTNAGETFEGQYFKLTADLWLSDESTPADERPLWVPIGETTLNNDDAETNPGGFYGKDCWFKGNFDGAGHTIHNLWYNGSMNLDDWNDPFGSGQLDFTSWNKALFGLLDGATVTNVKLQNVNIGGTALIGGFAIRTKNTTFTDVHVNGHIRSGNFEAGGSAAALVVEAYDSHFLRCTTDADVLGKSNTGGLIGILYGESTVEECASTGTVAGSVYVGGLIGVATLDKNSTSTATPIVTRSTSSALVTVINGRKQGNYGGGFIGGNSGTISRCSATGNVHVTCDVGAGFCWDNTGTIESCYATGDVYNEEYGVTLCSFVGDNGYSGPYSEYVPGTILNCYGSGRLYAPEPPADAIAMPTRIMGFLWANWQDAGSQLANCYYDVTKNPVLFGDGASFVGGSYGESTEYMQSQEFVDRLNFMAAVMGTYLWKYVPGDYPVPTDVKATDVTPFFAGGDGTAESPFLISNKENLENLAFAANRNWNFVGQHILQTADIALNEPMENWGEKMPEQWTPVAVYLGTGTGNNLTHHFCGIYDGGMHTVSNMYIDNEEMLYAGLFGVLGKGAEIRNLGVIDAWVSASSYVSPLAGANRIHNDCDQFKGEVTISHCWTSGQISGYNTGGILGEAAYGGNTYLNACYSTVESNGYAFIGTSAIGESFINGCWYAQKADGWLIYSEDDLFQTFVNSDLSPRYKDTAIGRTTTYMQSYRFVNDLNYAAAAKGFEGGWGYNEGGYPSFAGTQPTLSVTIEDGVNAPFSFKAFAGSTLSRPVAPQREGYVLLGWYTDKECTAMFDFGISEVKEDVTLYARWAEQSVPDYSIFQNKFTKTYTITTPAQLYAFANIVNGTAEGMERNDFSEKTVKLGADIQLNDVADFDKWVSQITPVPFLMIGNSNYAYSFNGTFDGQNHVISGIYMESEMSGSSPAFFRQVGSDAVIKNLILRDVCVNVNRKDSWAALFAMNLYGTITQCGAEGRIVETVGGIGVGRAGFVGEVYDGGTISECYAKVDIETDETKCAGLVVTNAGTIENSFAMGGVKYKSYANFGGVAVSTKKPLTNCYSAMSVQMGSTPDGSNSVFIGGVYGYAEGNETKTCYFNRDLVQTAFEKLSADVKPFDKGIGLVTSEMKRMSSFVDWDFENVWGRRADQNDGYPYLRWTASELDNDQDAVVAIEAITLDKTEIKGFQGVTVQLTATVTPDDASNKKVLWSSSDTNVAVVNETGLVTLVGGGTAVITATSEERPEIQATCDVIVIIPATGVKLSEGYVKGIAGETLQLTATVTPDNATNKNVVWSSSDDNVVVVDETGLLAFVAEGTAVITAALEDYPNVKATCQVTVQNPVIANSVTLNRSRYRGDIGETFQLRATVWPTNATDKTVSWSSSDMNVAMVDETGLVTLVGGGTAVITVALEANPDLKATCEVTVEGEDTGVSDVAIDSDSEVVVVSLQGSVLYVGKWADAHLAPNIYIVRRSDGVATKIRIK
ncbi:MAG: Ig-like domain-containing protein [Prevotella sp.]|nr:Ig-like domain-containing protein [Prevotella sp.]